MNKRQRALKRIERDKRLKYKPTVHRGFDDVMTERNLLCAFKKCKKGVSWKESVQKDTFEPFSVVYSIVKDYKADKFPRLKTNKKVHIYERGKKREITPIVFSDRIQQRCFCEHILLPAVTPHLIYDNGASLKGKGTGFSRSRVEGFLYEACKKWGNNFYILKFDFRHYFESISLKKVLEEANHYVKDEKSLTFTDHIIKNYGLIDIRYSGNSAKEKSRLIEECKAGNGKGLCLGSELSQILAIMYPNRLDHCIKENLHMRYYTRHVDDGIIIAETKEELQHILAEIKKICAELKLDLHPTKTSIVKASKGITYLKRRYKVTKTGKLIIRIARSSINRMKRKLRKFKKLYVKGNMTIEEITASLVSWLGHCKGANSYKSIKSVLRLYVDLFGLGWSNKIDMMWKPKYIKTIKRARKNTKKCIYKTFPLPKLQKGVTNAILQSHS